MNRIIQDGDNERKTSSNVDTRNVVLGQSSADVENAEQSYYENISEVDFRSSELSQTKSDIEAALGQSFYETVSEVESDVYYETGVQSGRTGEVSNQLEVTKTAEQSVLNSSSELQNNIPNTEVSVKDSLLSNKTSDNSTVQTDIKAYIDNNTSNVASQKASETIKTDESIVIETEVAKVENNDGIDRVKEKNTTLTRFSPEMIESDSKLSSSKFSRFNRKRRNSSGSESDGSGCSDVSSWSASHQSPFEFDTKQHDYSKSDVSSTPFPERSTSDKELSDKEIDSESDSNSSSSSSDESSVSSISSVELPNKDNEGIASKTKSVSLTQEKTETKKQKKNLQRETPDFKSREKENNKTEVIQRHVKDKKEQSHLKRDEKVESTTVKPEKTQKHESGVKKGSTDSYLLDSATDKPTRKQNKDKTEKIKDKNEKSKLADNEKTKSNNIRQERHKEMGDIRHFEAVFFVSGKDNDKYKKEGVKQLFPIKLEEDKSKSGVEQLVLDARKQELDKSGKEIRTVSLVGSVPKDKSQSKTKSHSNTESLRSKSHDSTDSHSKSSSMKDKIAANKKLESSRHEKSNRHRRSRSPTPPKAYLKAINKKAEQKAIKRLGSISPPKAYSKDLKKVEKEKKRKSSHSGERKRPSGSAKKNRKSDNKRNESDSDSGKSISSLSDTDSDSETENWRDKKSGVTRKRDDIERERRMRLAAERENLRKERTDMDSTKDSKDREHNGRRGEKYSGRSDERGGRSKAEIDSFDARDYRQHINRDARHRSHRDFPDRRRNEKVFYRKNKTFVEEEPLISKTTYFEEEVSDDPLGDDRKGMVSVIKPNRKRLSSEADLEDIKISTKHAKHKHEDLNKKVRKERLIISVQESSGDEKNTKSKKAQKSDLKRKKSKHKTHEKKASEEKDLKEQTVKVVFDKGKIEVHVPLVNIQEINILLSKTLPGL